MPIISIKKGDILRASTLEAGWYSFQITKLDGWHKSKDGTGNVIDVYLTLIDHVNEDMNGKELRFWISDKALSLALPLITAAQGIKKTDMPKEAFDFDTDAMLNAKVDCSIIIDTEYDPNNPQNRITDFAPYKTVVGAAPAF